MSLSIRCEIYGFSTSHVWMWELDYKESWAPKNWWFWTVVLEKMLESPLEWCWSWNSNTLAIWCQELTHLKRPWYWERLKAGGEGDDREWDGWMASPTPRTRIWADSRSWWWIGSLARCSPWGRKESDTTESLKWTELNWTDWLRACRWRESSSWERWVALIGQIQSLGPWNAGWSQCRPKPGGEKRQGWVSAEAVHETKAP